MSHPAGEKLRCEDCGAEIVFTKGCPCPDEEPKRHSDVCCGKEMRLVERGEVRAGESHPHHH